MPFNQSPPVKNSTCAYSQKHLQTSLQTVKSCKSAEIRNVCRAIIVLEEFKHLDLKDKCLKEDVFQKCISLIKMHRI